MGGYPHFWGKQYTHSNLMKAEAPNRDTNKKVSEKTTLGGLNG